MPWCVIGNFSVQLWRYATSTIGARAHTSSEAINLLEQLNPYWRGALRRCTPSRHALAHQRAYRFSSSTNIYPSHAFLLVSSHHRRPLFAPHENNSFPTASLALTSPATLYQLNCPSRSPTRDRGSLPRRHPRSHSRSPTRDWWYPSVFVCPPPFALPRLSEGE